VIFGNRPLEIVGVVRDIKGRDLFAPPGPMIYIPLSQTRQANIVLHLRTNGTPASLAADIRREVHGVDPTLPVYALTPLDEHKRATLTPQRLLASLVGGFGVLALVLSGMGLYGLLAYSVSERTPEIGIRMALGASRGEVVRLFVSGGMTLALTGIVIGGLAAAMVMPLMKRLLYGVRPLDPVTLTVVPIVLAIVAAVACALPARRAADVDPKTALRWE
jgi:ABC-type antimicrobial peptide transport system permease subunit